MVIKAFMSDRDGRERDWLCLSCEAGFKASDTEASIEAAQGHSVVPVHDVSGIALREARAILAVSERETRVSVLPCYFRAGHGVYAGMPHVALAEALRAFVESGE